MADMTRRRLTPLNDPPRKTGDSLNPTMSGDGYEVVNRPGMSGDAFGVYPMSSGRPELLPLAEPVFDGPNIPLYDDR